jgi:hypothetical protein
MGRGYQYCILNGKAGYLWRQRDGTFRCPRIRSTDSGCRTGGEQQYGEKQP